MLTGFAFQLQGCPYLFAAVLNIELVYDIQKGSKLVVALVGTVHTAVDCNEADIVLRKCDLCVHSYFQIVTPDPTHVFGYDDTDFSLIYKSHHSLPIRSLEVCTRVSVIHKILDVPKALFLCVFS